VSIPLQRPPLVEAAVDSLAAALAAEDAGADRLELCGDLDVGGVTPPAGLLREARRRTRLPIFTMIRPRAGSFVYSAGEIDAMLAAIVEARSLGASGIVTGALAPSGGVDLDAMRRLVAASRPLPVTFHKAFDRLADLDSVLETLVGLGIDRVLTSGGAATAAEGTAVIARLARRAGGRIIIVAGGGVNGADLPALVRATGISEVHARCDPDGARIRAIVAALR
jgi:copper homeostasis protein